MYTITVDFDVFKEITARRASEDVSDNDVLREVLGLPANQPRPTPVAPAGKGSWITKGVTFPVGTDFRANYKGSTYPARVEGGGLMLNGVRYPSPSAAAVSITGSAVNGWRFWEARLPGQTTWQSIEKMRKDNV
jgi:hypothetical protein